MKVNPEAGTATNPSADKLDGKSADEIGVNGLEQVFWIAPSTRPTSSR